MNFGTSPSSLAAAAQQQQSNLIDEALQLRQQILAKDIAWSGYQCADLITSAELELITAYTSSSAEHRRGLIARSGETYAAVFLTILTNVMKVDIVQYTLTLIDDVLADSEEHVRLFLAQPNAFAPFQKLLMRSSQEGDWYTGQKTSRILSLFILHSPREALDSDLVQQYTSWCIEQLRRRGEHDRDVALVGLQILLRKPEYRYQVAMSNAVELLSDVLHENIVNAQLTYQATYCVWLLSFEKSIGANFEPAVVKRVIEILRSVQKEKVIRVSLATLVNLLKSSEEQGRTSNLAMIDTGLMRVLNNLNQKKWGDDDIIADLEVLTEAVAANVAELSSFDAYKQELYAGRLDWSPVHRSEKFWRENAVRFEENNFQALAMLEKLLDPENDSDETTMAVACHDIGEFARAHPRGRQIVTKLNIKVAVMKLMTTSSADVQKEALLCTQKLMVTNWEYLAK